MLGRLNDGDRAIAAEALERLLRRYWPAIYAFIRGTGRDVHASTDLTQAFVSDVLLGRELMQRADPAKGRFRQLLLASVRRFLSEQHRSANRKRRQPSQGGIVPFGGSAESLPSADGDASPEEAFDRTWSRTVIHAALARVREECLRDGFDVHWAVFEARVMHPALHNAVPVEYRVLTQELDLPSAAHAANMLITVKRRFVAALRREIAPTVEDPSQIDQEIVDVLRCLEHRH